MVFDKIKRLANPLLTTAVIASIALTACGSGTSADGGGRTAQGTINLDGMKVGVPENVIQEAVLTFVLDEKAAAKAGGRNQYLSRSKDSKGAQYMAQCAGGFCFRIDAIYDTPITKAQAEDTLKHMLPGDTPPQSKVDDSAMSKDKDPKEKIYYGDDYIGVFVYTDKDAKQVKAVAAIDVPKMNVLKEDGSEPAKAEGDKAADDATEKKASEEKKESEN